MLYKQPDIVMKYWNRKEKLFKYVDEFLAHSIYKLFPDSHGVFIDISEEMINKARKRDNYLKPSLL